MKKCPYCGKEYPDDATVCIIDHEVLEGDAPEPPADKEPIADAAPAKVEPYLTYPEYQWRARDAWKCIGIIFVLGFFLAALTYSVSSHFPFFYRNGIGYASSRLFGYTVILMVTAYFARTETFAAFLSAFRLDRKPTHHVWFGIVMAVILRFLGYIMMVHRQGNGIHDYNITLFRNNVGFERFFFLFPLIFFAPLFEEPIYRGFLYKAFRGSYSVAVSTGLIIGWVCFTHWSQYSHSWVAAVDLSALTVVQCYLREKSNSLWDCILCHFVFNASLLLTIPRPV
jgi:membrane protease YdiL (CAAX protease family)